MTAADSSLSPDLILNHDQAVVVACGVLASLQLDIFTPLADEPRSADELAAVLGVDAAKLRPLLYLLAAIDLLTVTNERFANSPAAEHYLVRGRPTYLGGVHELWADLWPPLLQTAASIRTGRPQDKHDFAHMSREELATFFRGLQGRVQRIARTLAERYDLGTARTLLDAGGGSGDLAITLTALYPHLRATVVDLPAVTPLTHQFVADAGAADRVAIVAADLVREGVEGAFDVVVLVSVLQTLSAAEARVLVAHVGAATAPGGQLYIVGNVLDDSRLSPFTAVANNLRFVNIYDGGQAHTEQEHRAWLSAAGFTDIRRDVLPTGQGVIIGHKLG